MSSAVDNLADNLATASINEPTNGTAPTTAQTDAALVSADEGRRLYIGNLAYATTEGELKEFFSSYTMYVSSQIHHELSQEHGSSVEQSGHLCYWHSLHRAIFSNSE